MSAFNSYQVFPRKQRNKRVIYLASIKTKQELSARMAENSIFKPLIRSKGIDVGIGMKRTFNFKKETIFLLLAVA